MERVSSPPPLPPMWICIHGPLCRVHWPTNRAILCTFTQKFCCVQWHILPGNGAQECSLTAFVIACTKPCTPLSRHFGYWASGSVAKSVCRLVLHLLWPWPVLLLRHSGQHRKAAKCWFRTLWKGEVSKGDDSNRCSEWSCWGAWQRPDKQNTYFGASLPLLLLTRGPASKARAK